MFKTSKLCVVLLVWSFSAIAHANSDTPSPVLTGTVNIVLANSNGIVAITDSNQTNHMGGLTSTDPHPGQKLFRIDDRTVCTIAGFGSTSLPRFSEINSSAAGVLDAYVEELRRKGGTHSFHEKFTSLLFIFDFLLTGLGNLQHLDPTTVERDYGFELILAGYDTDGTPKVGKFILSTHLSADGIFSPVVKEFHETTVGKNLEHKTAGLGGGAVENVLLHPGKLEPEFARYAASRVSDPLTVAEMEALAKSLAHLSALLNSHTYSVLDNFGFIHFQTFWPVGGLNQIAILEKGSLSKLDQPTDQFRTRELNMTPVSIRMGIALDGGDVPDRVLYVNGAGGPDVLLFGTRASQISLIIRSRMRGGLVVLDNAYFFEDDFSDATLYYRGGVLGFDPSNRISNCDLNIAEGVDRNSRDVRELIEKFHWKTVK